MIKSWECRKPLWAPLLARKKELPSEGSLEKKLEAFLHGIHKVETFPVLSFIDTSLLPFSQMVCCDVKRLSGKFDHIISGHLMKY